MARQQPDRLKALLAPMKTQMPGLYEELLLSAVEHGDLDQDSAAEALGVTLEGLHDRLELYRLRVSVADVDGIVSLDVQGVARLRGTIIPVWEIVRAFRKVGSVTELALLFPSIPESSLRAALQYCGRHPDEIAAQIQNYESRRGSTGDSALVEVPGESTALRG